MNKEFSTKLNIGDNTFFKQSINSETKYEGINHFGVPLSKRKLGPNKVKNKITHFDNASQLHSFKIGELEDYYTITIKINNQDVSFRLMRELILTHDNFTLESDNLGLDPYYVKKQLFFNEYQWSSIDCSINEKTEDGDVITGYLTINNKTTYISESLDYKGDDKILSVAGDLVCDQIFGIHTFEVINMDADFLLDDVKRNVLVFHKYGSFIIDDLCDGYHFNVIIEDDKELEFIINDITIKIKVNKGPNHLVYANKTIIKL